MVSQPGEGATFHVYLPASREMPAEEPPLPETLPLAPSARVLVLDDEEAICALIKYALEDGGHEVVESYDALTAIQKYEEALHDGRRFDLVISDLTIPGGIGGREAVQRLRDIDPGVRAIVSSGYATDPVMSDYRQYGFCARLAKPYQIETLVRVVAEVLAPEKNDGPEVIPFPPSGHFCI